MFRLLRMRPPLKAYTTAVGPLPWFPRPSLLKVLSPHKCRHLRHDPPLCCCLLPSPLLHMSPIALYCQVCCRHDQRAIRRRSLLFLFHCCCTSLPHPTVVTSNRAQRCCPLSSSVLCTLLVTPWCRACCHCDQRVIGRRLLPFLLRCCCTSLSRPVVSTFDTTRRCCPLPSSLPNTLIFASCFWACRQRDIRAIGRKFLPFLFICPPCRLPPLCRGVSLRLKEAGRHPGHHSCPR